MVAARCLDARCHECDWSPVAKASLQNMSADAKKNVESVPDKWRASEISCFFTGRADWGLFASVFPCLWGEVAQKLTEEDDRAQALALVKSKDFLRVVQNFRRTEGIAPHPAVAYRILEAEKKKEQSRSCERASTPRSAKRRASMPLSVKKAEDWLARAWPGERADWGVACAMATLLKEDTKSDK